MFGLLRSAEHRAVAVMLYLGSTVVPKSGVCDIK